MKMNICYSFFFFLLHIINRHLSLIFLVANVRQEAVNGVKGKEVLGGGWGGAWINQAVDTGVCIMCETEN